MAAGFVIGTGGPRVVYPRFKVAYECKNTSGMVPKSHKQHARTHTHTSLCYSASFSATFSSSVTTRYSSHSPTDVRAEFRENVRNSKVPEIQFFFNSKAGKVTKVYFEMYNKKLRLLPVQKRIQYNLFISCGMQNTYPRLFLSLYRSAKIYIRSNFHESGSHFISRPTPDPSSSMLVCLFPRRPTFLLPVGVYKKVKFTLRA
jgi:hypothetical protein